MKYLKALCIQISPIIKSQRHQLINIFQEADVETSSTPKSYGVGERGKGEKIHFILRHQTAAALQPHGLEG